MIRGNSKPNRVHSAPRLWFVLGAMAFAAIILSEKAHAQASEEASKKFIEDFLKAQAEEPDVNKLEIVIDKSAKNPYMQAHMQYVDQIGPAKFEIEKAKQFRELNAIAEELGRPKLVVDLKSSSTPYAMAVNSQAERYSFLSRESIYKQQALSTRAALKALGIKDEFRLNLKSKTPYQNLAIEMGVQYPGFEFFVQDLQSQTSRKLECAERFTGLVKEANQSNGRVCEAPEKLDAQFTQLISMIQPALAAKYETKEQIEARETAATALMMKAGQGHTISKSRLHRFRPGFQDCGLTEVEIAALAAYTGSMFRIINRFLREGDNTYRPLIETIHSALAKLAPHKGVVSRGADHLGMDVDDIKEGSIKKFQSLLSTAIEGAPAFPGKFQFKIKTCSGRYIAPLSMADREEEVLIKAGAEFRVVKRSPPGDQIDIELEEVCAP